MQRTEILVTGMSLVPDRAVTYMAGRGYTPRRVRRDDLTEDELIEALAGAAGYLIGGAETPGDRVFECSRRLRAVAFVGTDYRTYVPGWRRARALGISVFSAPGANARSVAEFTLLLMLTQFRAFASVVDSVIRTGAAESSVGRTLEGKRLGIIGLGRIGREVARIGRLGFGMDVRYNAPRRDPVAERQLGVEYCSKEELLCWSDVVSLHRPGPQLREAPELGEQEFGLMRPGALLVNTVHPTLVDIAALSSAVRERGMRGAFDGRGSGPEWDSLVSLGPERFLAVPAMGYNTLDANEAASMTAARQVCDLLDSRTPREGECAGEPD